MIPAALQKVLVETLGSPVESDRSASGGCINSAASISLADGRRFFLMCHAAAPSGMFLREAEGLIVLRKAEALHVPEPIHAADDCGDVPAYILMEDVSTTSWDKQKNARLPFEEELGRGLARIHRVTADQFGFEHDNFIGPTPQPNHWTQEWTAFWREHRIGHMLRLLNPGREITRLADTFLKNTEMLLQTNEPPSLLHGDLWAGNVMRDQAGAPVLIDPAAYFGHREADLAMTELFGGFGSHFLDAYHEAWPIDSGYRERRDIYNLYHLLNHALLFGGGYISQAVGIMRRYI